MSWSIERERFGMSGLLDLIGGGVLFAEDFDLPEPDRTLVEPERADPVVDRAEQEASKVAAFEEGIAVGRAALLAEDVARVRQAVESLAGELHAAREDARMICEQAAEEIARLLLAALGAVMPVLCATFGAAEAGAVARAVLPALLSEPEITIRTNPHTAPALLAEFARIDPDIASRVQITPTDALLPGDLRIAWKDGQAVRDGAALWRGVVAILVPQGLLAGNLAINEMKREDARHGE